MMGDLSNIRIQHLRPTGSLPPNVLPLEFFLELSRMLNLIMSPHRYSFISIMRCPLFPSLVEKRDTQLHDVTFNGQDFAPDTEQIEGNVGLTVFDGLNVNDK